MGTTLIVATGRGIVTYERLDHAWREQTRGLDGQNVTSAIAREGVILAGTTNGVFRSDDYGETWYEGSSGLNTRHVRWMAFHPELSVSWLLRTSVLKLAACPSPIFLFFHFPLVKDIELLREWRTDLPVFGKYVGRCIVNQANTLCVCLVHNASTSAVN